MTTWYEDAHYDDQETGITGWGFLPTQEQQADRDATYIMELELRGFSLASILQTRSVTERVNWHYGDPEEYLETHWTIFEPGYSSEKDETVAQQTLATIQAYRWLYDGHAYCVEPSEQMKIDAGYLEPLPEGHGLTAVMVRDPVDAPVSPPDYL